MMRVTNSTLLALLVLSVGCSADIKRLSVSGTVSIDGKPIENCLLVFQSKDGGSNLGSTAIVSRGEFSLKDEVGLAEGEYAVIVMENQPDLEEYEERKAKDPRKALNQLRIPARYRSTSDLTVSVTSPNQKFDLVLQSK